MAARHSLRRSQKSTRSRQEAGTSRYNEIPLNDHNQTADTNQNGGLPIVLVQGADDIEAEKLRHFFQNEGIQVEDISIYKQNPKKHEVKLRAADDVPHAVFLSGRDLDRRTLRIEPAIPKLTRGHHPSVFRCPACTLELKKTVLPVEFHIEFSSNVGDWIKGKKAKVERRKSLQQLFRSINALLNSGGGVIYIHVHTRFLAFLDEQIDDRLTKLLPEDSLLTDHLVRQVIDDHHVVLRVKPHGGRLLTLDFKSKVSLNKGLDEANHAQMRRLIQRSSTGETQAAVDSSTSYRFTDAKNGERARIKMSENGTGNLECWFHENANLQAKAFTPQKDGILDGKQILANWWNLKLPGYISAFTKENGGSIFFGVREEKEEVLKWKPVLNTRGVGDVFQTEMTFWEDDQHDDIYYVAKESNVPRSGDATGHFLCEGIPLSQHDQNEMKKNLQDKLRNEMRWHPDLPAGQVELHFHPVADNSEETASLGATGSGNGACADKALYIVEARVKGLRGVCFHDKKGPEAYKFSHTNNPEKKVETLVAWDEWLRSYRNAS